MVHGTARVTRFRLQRLAAFLQDTAARPTIVQYLDLLLRAWRNGRRSRLRIWSRKGWRFKSSRAHHPLTIKANAAERAATDLLSVVELVAPRRSLFSGVRPSSG